jgi:hydroxymethylglutaryl-CoA reductase
MYEGNKEELKNYFNSKKEDFYKVTENITKNMRKRGGGILDIELRDKTKELANYYQIHVTFETMDSMGANFINSCLEAIANEFKKPDIQIVMSILSNYVPECLVHAEVSCKVEDLYAENSEELAQKFVQAVQIANAEPHRAVTHNKGIMNGIDAVVIATGNDFRAIEAGAHAYASRSGKYKSLTNASIENGIFKFWIEIPLALGTVGGLTKLHPLSKLSLELLENPSAKELMEIIAVAGLAQNFAALRALTTTGIQKGHMKMHLTNIIKQLGASEEEKAFLIDYFEHKTVTHNAVVEAYKKLAKDK